MRPLSMNNLGVEELVKGPGNESDRPVVNGEAARAKPHVADHTTTEKEEWAMPTSLSCSVVAVAASEVSWKCLLIGPSLGGTVQAVSQLYNEALSRTPQKVSSTISSFEERLSGSGYCLLVTGLQSGSWVESHRAGLGQSWRGRRRQSSCPGRVFRSTTNHLQH